MAHPPHFVLLFICNKQSNLSAFVSACDRLTASSLFEAEDQLWLTLCCLAGGKAAPHTHGRKGLLQLKHTRKSCLCPIGFYAHIHPHGYPVECHLLATLAASQCGVLVIFITAHTSRFPLPFHRWVVRVTFPSWLPL